MVGHIVRDAIEGVSRFFKPYDFFAFLLPGLIFLIALSLGLSGLNNKVSTEFIRDSLPDHPWLQGGSVIIIAYVIGLLISFMGRFLAWLFFRRRPECDFREKLKDAQQNKSVETVSYGEAWVMLRESEDKESYNFCYYLWGLEAMLRGFAVAFMFLALAFLKYEFFPGILDNIIVFGFLWLFALLFLWESKKYYKNMLSELAESVEYKRTKGV